MAIHLPQYWSIARRQGCQQVHAVGLDYILESKDVNLLIDYRERLFAFRSFGERKKSINNAWNSAGAQEALKSIALQQSRKGFVRVFLL